MNTKSEQYVEKILKETGLSRKEIQELVEKKKNELKGLISEDGALFIVASELGINVKEENKDLLKEIEINTADIKVNMKNITLIGRIKSISDIFEFKRDDGTVGRVGSFILQDNEGEIRIVLWDDDVKLLSNPQFEPNEVVKIINGYAKKGRNNKPEVHVGRLGKVILSPDDVDFKKIPKIRYNFKNIGDISLKDQSVNLKGVVSQIFPVKEFFRKDGTKGKLRTLILRDNTGSIKIIFWNKDIEKIDNIFNNNKIKITNLIPKLNNLDLKTIELTATSTTSVNILKEKEDIPDNNVDKISKLQNMSGLITFKGIITSIEDVKKISTKSGEIVDLLSFIVSDDSDWIRVTLWRDKAIEYSKKLNISIGVLLRNFVLKYNTYSQRNEVNSLNDSKIKLININFENLKEINLKREKRGFIPGKYIKVKDIKTQGIYTIKGFIIKELSKIFIYNACSECSKKIENCECNSDTEVIPKMIINLIIDDGTGIIRATFIGDVAEKIIGEKTHIIKTIQETPDFENFLISKSRELMGKELIIKGKAKFSDFSKTYELMVYDFDNINIENELEKIIKEIET